MQYVVRIIDYGEEPDFKSFGDLRDARRRYNRAAFRALEDELQSVALFRVETDDVRKAVDAVKEGNSGVAALMELTEDTETTVSRLKLDIDL
ncbi:MAG: hypothetical protein H6897_15965 [Rhodobacteraceae bacterium]|jgi:hypothetical protein|uniref:hypothetical protein n=1 Tax=Albidovulum sp. TaxID=1872424 RepID=UPI001D8C2E2B|nr:hypothetical protein [uncultured Defluviimonas sp.]MCB2126457.1 hypothetical protein [Paracoccaceae bacterium]MCC0071412.1 hypothetical protein [Paracoccaceae bacterium]